MPKDYDIIKMMQKLGDLIRELEDFIRERGEYSQTEINGAIYLREVMMEPDLEMEKIKAHQRSPGYKDEPE